MKNLPPEIMLPIKNFFVKKWAVILIIVLSIIMGYVSVVFFGSDNAVEQQVEKVIETETGVGIDLTPF